jgi:hypothetical protein
MTGLLGPCIKKLLILDLKPRTEKRRKINFYLGNLIKWKELQNHNTLGRENKRAQHSKNCRITTPWGEKIRERNTVRIAESRHPGERK